MNERDLLEALGALSDETIARTVTEPVESVTESGISEIERLIAEKPEQPEQTVKTQADVQQTVSRNRTIRMRMPAAAVVAACILLNIGILFGVSRMGAGKDERLPEISVTDEHLPTTSVDTEDLQDADALYVEVQENSVSPIACTLILHNDTEETVSYAESFHIYDKTGKEVNPHTFSASAYVIEPGKTGKLNCQYGDYYEQQRSEQDVYYVRGDLPLEPGEYEIEVSFITSSEYIQRRRTTLTVTDEYENMRPIDSEFGQMDVLDVIRHLKDRGFKHFEVVAEPTKTEQYLSAGQVQRTEPHGKYVDGSYDYNTNPPHSMINPEDFVWVDKDETIKIYASTGSHDPNIVRLPDFDGPELWDHEWAEQFLTSAGLDVYVQYLKEYTYMCPVGSVIRCDPGSADSKADELHIGDPVVLYVSGTEKKYVHSEEQTPADTETIPVPDFTGMAVQTAKKIAEEAGIHLSITLKDSYEPYGTVIRQGMAPGDTRIGKGDYLELEISNGKG